MLFSLAINVGKVLSSGICNVAGLSEQNAIEAIVRAIKAALWSGSQNIQIFFGNWAEPDAILETGRNLVWSKYWAQKTMLEVVRRVNPTFSMIWPTEPVQWVIALSPLILAAFLAYLLSPGKDEPTTFNYGKLLVYSTILLYLCWIGLAIYKSKYDVFVKIQIPLPRQERHF